METINIVADYALEETLEEMAEKKNSKNNPYIAIAEFVFTDDQPNANKQRIDKSEFKNIISTGKHMPIKMQQAEIDGKHELSTPIGTIINLKQQDNKVIGVAALWRKERPDDVKLVEEAYAEGKPLKLSWEVLYDEAELDSDGISSLKGTTVRGISFVGNPAYEGRTNVFAIAEHQLTQEETNLADTNNQEIEKVTELTTRLAELESALAAKEEELKGANSELTTLRQEKEDREKADAKASLLATRKNAWKEAKLDEKEYDARLTRIEEMSDEAFSSYVQDLVTFSNSTKPNESTSSVTNPTVPDITSPDIKDAKTILIEAFNNVK